MINRLRNWLAGRLRRAASRITPPVPRGKFSTWITIQANSSDLPPAEVDEILAAAHRHLVIMCRRQARLHAIDTAFDGALPQHLRETGGL